MKKTIKSWGLPVVALFALVLEGVAFAQAPARDEVFNKKMEMTDPKAPRNTKDEVPSFHLFFLHGGALVESVDAVVFSHENTILGEIWNESRSVTPGGLVSDGLAEGPPPPRSPTNFTVRAALIKSPYTTCFDAENAEGGRAENIIYCKEKTVPEAVARSSMKQISVFFRRLKAAADSGPP